MQVPAALLWYLRKGIVTHERRSSEDVLDSDTLAKIERVQTEAEAAAPSRMSDQATRASALDVRGLRALADRTRRGEYVSLKKT